MRLFVAAQLPQEIVEALCETSASLRASVRGRYVAPELFHVTLAFLGERPESELPELTQAVAEACATQKAFSITLGELGLFGRASSAYLWQGFAAGRDEWEELARAVRSSLTDHGYHFDTKSFIPHITLIQRADVSRVDLPMPQVERGVVSTVTLFSSDHLGGRSHYEALASWELARP